jgi:hypothetical protein
MNVSCNRRVDYPGNAHSLKIKSLD